MQLKTRHKTWERSLSFFLATAVFSSAVVSVPISGFADSAKTSDPTAASKLFSLLQALPRETASVEDIQFSRSEKTLPLVVHIQDAHSNPSAQKNIHTVLNILQESFPRMAVGVEGAAGPLHPEYFDLFPDYPKANQKMIEDLAAKGEISGAELFAWENYQRRAVMPAIFGIEDPELYRANVKQFQDLLASRDKIDPQLQYLRSWLATMESKKLNSELREFLKEKDRRKEGRFDQLMSQGNSDYSAYLAYAVKEAKNQLGIDLDHPLEQFRFPNLVRYQILQKEEKVFDAEAAKSEWKEFLKELRAKASTDTEKALVQSLDLFIRKNLFTAKLPHADIEEADYARALTGKLAAFSVKKTADVGRFLQALRSLRFFIFQSEIKSEGLFEEIERLEAALLFKLAKTPDEKKWAQYHEALARLEKLLHLELTHKELVRIQQVDDVRPMIQEALLVRASEMFEWIRQAEEFYETALKRDQVLAENALKGIGGAKPEVLVLITGGFHQEGIRRILEARKAPYALMTPAITSLDSAKLYLDAMSGVNSDLSVYLEKQNPFTSERDALFFKTMLETGIPVITKDYQVSLEKLPEILAKAVEQSPALSQSFTAERVQADDSLTVRISPRLQAPQITPERFTVASSLKSSGIDLSQSRNTEPFRVDVQFGPSSFQIIPIAISISQARISTQAKVQQGALGPEQLRRARTRSEVRSRQEEEQPFDLQRAISSLEQRAPTNSLKGMRVNDRLIQKDIHPAIEQVRVLLNTNQGNQIPIQNYALALGRIRNLVIELRNPESGISPNHSFIITALPKLARQIHLASQPPQLQPLLENTQTTLEQLGQFAAQAYSGMILEDILQIPPEAKTYSTQEGRYIPNLGSARLEQFFSRSDSKLDLSRIFVVSQNKTNTPKVHVRASVFHHFALLALARKHNQEPPGAAGSPSEALESEFETSLARAELRKVNQVSDIMPTDQLRVELLELAETGLGKQLLLLPEASVLGSVAPVDLTAKADSASLQLPFARQWGMIPSVSARGSDLLKSLQDILGPYARVLDPRTPAVHLTVPEFEAPDLSPQGLERFVNERITLFLEGIINGSSRVDLILPVSRSDAAKIQAVFSRHALRLGLEADYVTVTGAGDRVLAETFKLAALPQYKDFANGVVVFDEKNFSGKVFQGVVPLSAGKLNKLTAAVLSPDRLRALTAEELSRRVWPDFISLEAYANQLGVNADFETHLRLLVQTLRSFDSAA